MVAEARRHARDPRPRRPRKRQRDDRRPERDRYLEIEHTRLGELLSYAVKVDPAVETCAIPPLAVQTLVENSLKHAIARLEDERRTELGVSRDRVRAVKERLGLV